LIVESTTTLFCSVLLSYPEECVLRGVERDLTASTLGRAHNGNRKNASIFLAWSQCDFRITIFLQIPHVPYLTPESNINTFNLHMFLPLSGLKTFEVSAKALLPAGHLSFFLLFFRFKRTWNENHDKNTKCCHWHCTQAEFERKRGELAAREWRRSHGAQRNQ
jgi:hypothetical protein